MYKLNLMNQYFALFLLLIFPVLSIAQELEIPKQSVYQVRNKMELQTLNGKWKFKYIENKDIPSSLSGFVESNFDDSTWDYITVPSNWETEGEALLIHVSLILHHSYILIVRMCLLLK